MSLPRKRYRQYLEPGSDSSKIPKSTYYRWKSQGRTLPNHVPNRSYHEGQHSVNTGDPSATFPLESATALDSDDSLNIEPLQVLPHGTETTSPLTPEQSPPPRSMELEDMDLEIGGSDTSHVDSAPASPLFSPPHDSDLSDIENS